MIGTTTSLNDSRIPQDARNEQSDATQAKFVISGQPESSIKCLSRNLSSLKNSAREMLRRRGDSHLAIDNLTLASAVAPDGSLNHFENEKVPESSRTSMLPTSSFLDSLGNLAVPQTLSSESQKNFVGTPPGTSALQCSADLLSFLAHQWNRHNPFLLYLKIHSNPEIKKKKKKKKIPNPNPEI